MKNLWKRQRRLFRSAIAYFLARSIGRTLRIAAIGTDHFSQLKNGVIFVGWHGKSFIPANYFSGKGVWALFSLSNDGEIQSRIFRRFGFRVIRGSTGRGGARALIESIRVLREGERMAITPDGPRGPARVIQPGVLAMAQKSGAALIPVGSAARHASILSTWDSYMIPWFFSHSAIVFGAPIFVAEDATQEQAETIRAQLHNAIEQAESAAEQACGAPLHLPQPAEESALQEKSATGAK